MPLYVSIPASDRTVPGIVVVHGNRVWKISSRIRRGCSRQVGYAAVAPNLYHRDGPDCKDDNEVRKSRLRDPSIIRDIKAQSAFSKITRRSTAEARHRRLLHGRAVGLSDVGGEYGLKAGVLFYGSSTMEPYGEAGRSPFDRTREINCPIQGHFGADDQNPSPEDVRKLDAELSKFGKPHEFHSYAGAAHAFVNSGSGNYRPHAAAQSWPKAMGFLPVIWWGRGSGGSI